MNGLYILFPISGVSVELVYTTRKLNFNPYLPSNLKIVQDFAKLEYNILENYKQTRHCPCKISNLLSKTMYSGFIKLYKEYNKLESLAVTQQPISTMPRGCEQSDQNCSIHPQYIIKISGIWESNTEIGLTYKLFEANENYIC